MGAWGGGLYDSDPARDLKGLIAGLLRAPLSDDELLAEIRAAHRFEDADYWLVLADQFERRGIPRRDVFERAIGVIEQGEDVAMLEELGASAKTIARRQKDTAELLERLRNPRPARTRKPLRTPQPLLFETGEALIWPTARGESINPYVPPEKLHLLGGFKRDGWGFGVVTAAGHCYEVLAWYAVQVLLWRRPERPSPELAIHCRRSEHHFGTMTELHFQRAKVERLGPVAPEAFQPPHPQVVEVSSRRAALQDLGLSDAFGIDAFNRSIYPRRKFPHPALSDQPLDPDAPDQRPGFGWFHE